MQALPLPANLLASWKSKNYHFALDVCYVSNLPTDRPLRLSKDYVSKYLGDNSFWQMVISPEGEPNPQFWTSLYFDKAFSAQGEKKHRTMKGSYLRIVSAYERQEHAWFVSNNIKETVNLIRLKYGIGAALECADTIEHNFTNNTISKTCDPVLVTCGGDGKTQNVFYQRSKSSGFLKNGNASLKPEASILFRQAFETQNAYHRFLFLWIALESQLGDGKARSKFCQDILQSKFINSEMMALHDLRCAYAHRGEEVENEVLSLATEKLLELLRISAVENNLIRKKLVQIFENEKRFSPAS